MKRVLAVADRIAATHPPWWLWNVFLLTLGIGAFGAALLLSPGADEFCYLPDGTQFGETCAFITVTGQPCPQCGMTRSWVYGARGMFVTAFWYNPAGLALFLWIQVGALIGAARLVVRDPKRFVAPWRFNVGWAMFWLIVLYAIPWVLRLFGVNPLAM